MEESGSVMDKYPEKETTYVSYKEAEQAFTRLKEYPSDGEEDPSTSHKVDWDRYLTCGNCVYYRDLNAPKEEWKYYQNLKSYEYQDETAPKICGANPAKVILVPEENDEIVITAHQTGGGFTARKRKAPKLKNIWPFPSANEPACRHFMGNKSYQDFLIKED